MALGVLAIMASRSGIAKSNFDRLQVGMTIEETEAVFGQKSSLTGDFMAQPEGTQAIWQSVDHHSCRFQAASFSKTMVCSIPNHLRENFRLGYTWIMTSRVGLFFEGHRLFFDSPTLPRNEEPT